MAERREEGSGWAAASGWFLVAAALRFVFLGRFSLWGDEVYSLDDALDLFTERMKTSDLAFPLFYLLERGVLELTGLARQSDPDPRSLQLALRVVPALAGALAAAAAFLSPREFLARRERHLLAAFIAFSPWLLFFSQTARFYTLQLALAIPATFELLRAARDASVRRGLVASVWLLLATLVQPTALLLFFGHCVGAVVAAAIGARKLNRGHVAPLALPVALGIATAIWPAVLNPLFFTWNKQDAGVESPQGLLLGIGFNVGPLVAALAFLGIPSLWRRDRAFAAHVVAGVGAPVALLVALAAVGKSVEQRYLIALLPLALAPAAVFLNELADLVTGRTRAPRWVVAAAALLPYGPGLASEYIDGDRHDLAGAGALVSERLGPEDGVIAETHALMRRYLPSGLPEERLIEAPPERYEDLEQLDEMWRTCPRIWVVIHAEFEDMGEPHPSFQEWAWTEGRLIAEFWRPRLDYHQNRLRVFLVDPARAQRWRAR